LKNLPAYLNVGDQGAIWQGQVTKRELAVFKPEE